MRKIDGVWYNWNWKEVGQEVRKMAAYRKAARVRQATYKDKAEKYRRLLKETTSLEG